MSCIIGLHSALHRIQTRGWLQLATKKTCCTPLFIAFKLNTEQSSCSFSSSCTPLFIAFKHIQQKTEIEQRISCTPLFIAFKLEERHQSLLVHSSLHSALHRIQTRKEGRDLHSVFKLHSALHRIQTNWCWLGSTDKSNVALRSSSHSNTETGEWINGCETKVALRSSSHSNYKHRDDENEWEVELHSALHRIQTTPITPTTHSSV